MKNIMTIVFLVFALGLLSAQTRTGQQRKVRPFVEEDPPEVCECVPPDCNGQDWDPDLCEWVGDCGFVTSSDWVYVIPRNWTLIPLEEGITIPTTGRYEVEVEATIGLWPGGPPSAWGVHTDREVRLWRKPAAGLPRWLAGVQATANVTSQAYMNLSTWLELQAGDKLRVYFLYRTNEWELPVILSWVSVRLIEEQP